MSETSDAFEHWWSEHKIPYGSATPREIALIAWKASQAEYAKRLAKAYEAGGKDALCGDIPG